ncbi:MAG: hypothetical protein IJ668_09785 [Selenomonadaceae bacterium]|nr:hypothetical protein [Selenomonadaceae bacterium]
MERKWYQQTWFLIVMMIVFWPVGVYLVYKNQFMSKNAKFGLVGGFFGLLFLLAMIPSGNQDSSTTKQPTSSQQSQQEQAVQESAEDKETRLEEERQRAEEERQRKEEERQRKEEERQRKEEEARQKEEQRKYEAELKWQQQEEERRRAEEQAIRDAERKRQEELRRYTEVSADTLLAELDSNAALANRNYLGKKLKVVGKLESIDSSGDSIMLDGFGEYFSLSAIHCHIDTSDKRQEDYVLSLRRGQRVTAYGTVSRVGDVIGYAIDVDYFE